MADDAGQVDADRGDLRGRLRAWVEERLRDDAGPTADAVTDVWVSEFDTPVGVGHSNETLLFDARWHDADGDHDVELVARLETTNAGVFPRYDLGLQVECLRQLAPIEGVPVPTVCWAEPEQAAIGRAFYVMDRIDGVVPADRMPYTLDGWLFEASPTQQRQVWDRSLDVLAAVHAVDWKGDGFTFLDRPEHGPTGLEQQHAWWDAYATWVCQGRPQSTIDAAGDWLRLHRPTPSGPVGVSWGDARISNLMYRDFEPVAVLDWEMASLGPGEVDLAWFIFFGEFFSAGLGVVDLPGFPSAAESVARYEDAAGREVDDLFWYSVFAAWRHSTVMLRLADMYEATGEIPAGQDAGGNNIATRMLAAMLDLPSPGEPGGPFG